MKAEIKINTMIADWVKWKIGRANDKIDEEFQF